MTVSPSVFIPKRSKSAKILPIKGKQFFCANPSSFPCRTAFNKCGWIPNILIRIPIPLFTYRTDRYPVLKIQILKKKIMTVLDYTENSNLSSLLCTYRYRYYLLFLLVYLFSFSIIFLFLFSFSPLYSLLLRSSSFTLSHLFLFPLHQFCGFASITVLCGSGSGIPKNVHMDPDPRPTGKH